MAVPRPALPLLALCLALLSGCPPPTPRKPAAPASGTLQLSAGAYAVAEAAGNATLNVTRQGGSAGAVTVQYEVVAGSASPGPDYPPLSGTLSWNDADAMVRIITIPVQNDLVAEGDEFVTVVLSLPSGGAQLGQPSSAVLTIVDDDAPNGALQFTSATYAGDEAGGSTVVAVSRTGGSGGPVSVDVATADGSATGGIDYASIAVTLSWSDGQTGTQYVSVSIADDLAVEGPEDFLVSLSNATGGAVPGTQSTTTVTIVDDDAPGTLAFTSATYGATESGTLATVTVVRSGGSGGAVSITYTASIGSADATDFVPVAGTITWLAGETGAKSFFVAIIDDAVYEPAETVNLLLSNATGGATLGSPGTAILTILNDDAFTATADFEPQTYLGPPIPISINGQSYSGNKVLIWKNGKNIATFYTSSYLRATPADGGGGFSVPSQGFSIVGPCAWVGGAYDQGSDIQSMTVTVSGSGVSISATGIMGAGLATVTYDILVTAPTDLATTVAMNIGYGAPSPLAIDPDRIAKGEGCKLFEIKTFLLDAATYDSDRFIASGTVYPISNSTGWLISSGPVAVANGALEARNGGPSAWWVGQSPPPNAKVTVSPTPANAVVQGWIFATTTTDQDNAAGWIADQSVTTMTGGSYTLNIVATQAGP
jgi:hypothetical protein